MTDPKVDLPKGIHTVLRLYVTAKEAYEKWKAEPEQVKIIDVRTPEEYLFVGHPTMAWKIPVAAQSYAWDAEKKKFPMKPLMDFVARVSEVANIVDGMEWGLHQRAPRRLKYSGCPWTKKLTPERMKLPRVA